MRPAKLTMVAFGPYAGEQVIDFRQLGGRNLFVISGNTGSGKTTILDAICYALYGRASGRDRDGESLRSHFAADDLLTAVELEFELGGKCYRVRRIPKQMKKKVRGGGFTEQGAEAELICLSEPASLPVCGIKEVNDKVVAILGITYDQFKQIILIPQGEFRELLTADSKTREDILQKIFGTEGFRRVQILLEDQAKTLSQAVDILRIRQQDALKQLDAADSPELVDLVSASIVHIPAVIAAAEAGLQADADRIVELEQRILAQETNITKQQQAIFTAQENNRKLAACGEAQARLAALETKRSAVIAEQERLGRSRQALSVTGADELLRSRLSEQQVKRQAAIAAERQEQLAAAAAEAASRKRDAELAKEGERQELFLEQSVLAGLRSKIQEWDERQTVLSKLFLEQQGKQQAQEAAKEQIKNLRESIRKSRERWEDALQAGREYSEKTVDKDKAAAVCTKLKDLTEQHDQLLSLRQTFGRLQQLEKQARLACDKACLEFEQAQEAFLTGQAGLLAGRLTDGKPCPVCGSREHPQPAMQAQALSEVELKQLNEQYRQLRDEYDQIKADYDRVRADGEVSRQLVERLLGEIGTLAALDLTTAERDKLSGFLSRQLALWQDRLQTVTAELHALTQRKSKAAAWAQEVERQEKASEQAEKSAELLQQQFTTLFAQTESAKEAVRSLASELPEDIRSLTVLDKKLQAIAMRYTALKQALEIAEENCRQAELSKAQSSATAAAAYQAADEAEQAALLAQRQFAEALAAAGFPDAAAYQAAKLSLAAMAELETAINRFHAEFQSAQDSYKAAQQAATGLVAADTALLEADLRQLEMHKQQMYETKTAVAARQNRNRSALAIILQLVRELEDKEEENRLIGHLAKVAKGDNQQRISFERYVLAAFFQDIIAAANLRLRKMTGDRYHLRRMEERGKGGGQSGLELEVFDYYTGRARHVKLLSGGESFKASLSLALGLADVVQSYAGGITIDTMLVDEGFGTLDPESLDSAINTLVELQHSGRLVGIISHVPELKASIDARLEIEARKDGSKAVLHIG